MATEDDYRRAQKDETYRQAFLDSIDLEDARPYIERVVYRNEDFGGRVMGCSHWNKKGRSEIIVYPVAFATSYIQLLDDFLGILIDHEGYHAREAYEVSTSSMTLLRRLISKKFYIRHYLESEIRARFNELRCIEQNERNFSQPYKELTMKSFYDDMAMLIELYNPAEIQLELTREPL